MLARSVFEYTVIRIVPRVEREEFINAGVVLFCRTRRFLDARVHLDRARLAALWPGLEADSIQTQLDHIPLVCAGGAEAGPIGLLPHHERFRWLAAPRSTIIQASPVHSGLCTEPREALDHLFARMVLPPADAGQRRSGGEALA